MQNETPLSAAEKFVQEVNGNLVPLRRILNEAQLDTTITNPTASIEEAAARCQEVCDFFWKLTRKQIQASAKTKLDVGHVAEWFELMLERLKVIEK